MSLVTASRQRLILPRKLVDPATRWNRLSHILTAHEGPHDVFFEAPVFRSPDREDAGEWYPIESIGGLTTSCRFPQGEFRPSDLTPLFEHFEAVTATMLRWSEILRRDFEARPRLWGDS